MWKLTELLKLALRETENVSSGNTQAWVKDQESGDEESSRVAHDAAYEGQDLGLEHFDADIYEPRGFSDALGYISTARDTTAFSRLKHIEYIISATTAISPQRYFLQFEKFEKRESCNCLT